MSHKLQIKQVDLSHVNEDPTKTKFLVIDDDGNVYWSTAAGDSTYTNATPVPETIGGIEAGSTFDNATMQEMWDDLLYPYQYPYFSSFTVSGGNGPFEVGQSLPNFLSFAWTSENDANVQPFSVQVYDVTGTILAGREPDDSGNHMYGTAIVRTNAGSYSWTVEGTNTELNTYSASTSKTWYWRVFWGTSATIGAPTEALVEGLTNGQLMASFGGTYSFLANDYKYLCIPDALGIPTEITYNGLGFALADSADGYNLGSGSITYTAVSVTNPYGVTATYNIFRSKNPIVGLISIVVS